jgi:hypothetical protein
MDFDKIHELASRIPDKIGKIQNEDAAKMAFVQPFISALGYDIHDPAEIMPEYSIDLGGGKKDYVDYVIFRDGEPVILIECKWCGTSGMDLTKEHCGQLRRYYNLSPAKFGILTNGITYKFYSDLDQEQRMDKRPFLELNLLNIKDPIENDPVVAEIKSFSKPIDKDVAYERAQELKYMKGIRDVLENEFNSPSEEFVKFFASTCKIYKGHLVKGVADKFKEYTKMTCDQFIQDKIDDTFKAAKEAQKAAKDRTRPQATSVSIDITPEPPKNDKKYFIFNKERFEIKFWKDMLPKVCSIMALQHKDRLEELFSIKGDIYPYFSRNQQELKSPEPIEGTDIYVETNYAKGMLLKIARDVVTLFGYPEDIVSFGEDQE